MYRISLLLFLSSELLGTTSSLVSAKFLASSSSSTAAAFQNIVGEVGPPPTSPTVFSQQEKRWEPQNKRWVTKTEVTKIFRALFEGGDEFPALTIFRADGQDEAWEGLSDAYWNSLSEELSTEVPSTELFFSRTNLGTEWILLPAATSETIAVESVGTSSPQQHTDTPSTLRTVEAVGVNFALPQFVALDFDHVISVRELPISRFEGGEYGEAFGTCVLCDAPDELVRAEYFGSLSRQRRLKQFFETLAENNLPVYIFTSGYSHAPVNGLLGLLWSADDDDVDDKRNWHKRNWRVISTDKGFYGVAELLHGLRAIVKRILKRRVAEDVGTDSGMLPGASFFFVDSHMGRAKEVADTFPQAKVLGWEPSGEIGLGGSSSWTWVQGASTATSAHLLFEADPICSVYGESRNPDDGPKGISEHGLDIFQNILAVAGVVPFRFPPAPLPRLNFVAVLPRLFLPVYINLQTLTLQTHTHRLVPGGRGRGEETFEWGKLLEDDGTVYYYNATTDARAWELPTNVDSSSLEFLVLRPAPAVETELVYIDLSSLDRADRPTGAGAQSGSWVKFLSNSASTASSSDHYVATWDEDEMAAAELSLRQGTEMPLRTMPENMVLPPLFRWRTQQTHGLAQPGPIIENAVWDTWELQAVFHGVQQPGPSGMPSSTGGYSGPPPLDEVDGHVDVPFLLPSGSVRLDEVDGHAMVDVPFLLPSGSVRTTIDALNLENKPSDSSAMSYCKRNGFAVMWSNRLKKYYLLWRSDRVVDWNNIRQTLERFGVRLFKKKNNGEILDSAP